MELIAPSDGPYVLVQGKKLLDFSSCDFLGLAQHPEVKKASIKYTLKYGVGIPVAPLGSAPQKQLESKLATYLGTEASLLFPSFDEVKKALATQKTTLLSSETDDIEKPPKKAAGLLCLDDTFLLGISGENGFAHHDGFDIVFGSLAYGVGASGGFIAGSKKLLSSFASSEPLSFPALGAIDSALSFIPELEHERQTLEKNRRWLGQLLKSYPAKMLKSPRALLQFKSPKEAEQTRQALAAEQIFLAPPVEKTLYIAMTALHTPDDLDQLTVALKKFSATDWALEMQSLTPTP